MSLDQAHTNDEEMSFLEHLEILRWHLIRSFAAIIVGACLAFVNKSFVFDSVILAPKSGDFITYKWLCKASAKLSEVLPSLIGPDTLCIGQNMPDLQNLNMAGQFTSHIMISLVVGLIIAFPYIVWEVWRFVKPALTEKERKNSTSFIFMTSTLFLAGVLFAYYIIAPLSIHFFLNYQVSDAVQNIPQLSSYNGILVNMVLGCGFLFELPVLIYFLAKGGVITAGFLKNFRKMAFVACLILSAVITPPDIFSQVLVTGPLMLLYELGIVIAYRVEVKEKALAKQDE